MGDSDFFEYTETFEIYREIDPEGNLRAKNGKDNWKYNWLGNGMLKEVTRPDGKKVCFEYDALGQRTVKIYEEKFTDLFGTATRHFTNGSILEIIVVRIQKGTRKSKT